MCEIALSYCGTEYHKEIGMRLNSSVSDVRDDVRRAAVISLGFSYSGTPGCLRTLWDSLQKAAMHLSALVRLWRSSLRALGRPPCGCDHAGAAQFGSERLQYSIIFPRTIFDWFVASITRVLLEYWKRDFWDLIIYILSNSFNPIFPIL